MADKTWKAVERRIAAYLTDQTGIPFKRLPSDGFSTYDIVSAVVGIESKRRRLPAWLLGAVAQSDAHAARTPGKLPVVSLADHRAPAADILIVMRAEVFARLLAKKCQ